MVMALWLQCCVALHCKVVWWVAALGVITLLCGVSWVIIGYQCWVDRCLISSGWIGLIFLEVFLHVATFCTVCHLHKS